MLETIAARDRIYRELLTYAARERICRELKKSVRQFRGCGRGRQKCGPLEQAPATE